jgi:aminoglycoside 3-N-acetyltransferase
MSALHRATGHSSRLTVTTDLEALGLQRGDTVMVHAGMRSVGRLLGGPDALLEALLDVVGPTGTLVAYTDWEASHLALADEHGRVPEPWREHVAPFHPATSRAAREYGVLPEFLRTRPSAVRSANPGASVAALGAHAHDVVADHPLDYGYGEGSPFSTLVALQGRVLMVGAPRDAMTLLHHAEHLARVPGKRVVRVEVPLADDRRGVRWQWIEEYDTEHPVLDGLPEDCFSTIVDQFVAEDPGARTGLIGEAESLCVPAAAVVQHAVAWLESHAPSPDQA